MTNKLFCFGFGYTAGVLAARLAGPSFTIVGTRRKPEVSLTKPAAIPLGVFDGTQRSAEVTSLLPDTTHVLISTPPGSDGDPVLRWHSADLARLSTLKWIGYLSTIGVYGDSDGGWVDETSPMRPTSERGRRRAAAETDWRAFAVAHGKRIEIFRLPGIYGPGRNTLETIRAGTARRIVKPGQVFNRVHVADIATTLARAMTLASNGLSPGYDAYNVVDDEPAPPQDVVTFAADLLGLPPPPEIPFDAADLSPMARSFYGENKRVSNARLKSALLIDLAYPTYREGLRALSNEL